MLTMSLFLCYFTGFNFILALLVVDNDLPHESASLSRCSS